MNGFVKTLPIFTVQYGVRGPFEGQHGMPRGAPVDLFIRSSHNPTTFSYLIVKTSDLRPIGFFEPHQS